MLFSYKNGSGTICPKVNVIARLEYELAYYDSAVRRFNHYTTRTLPLSLGNILLLRYIEWFTNSRGLFFKVAMALSCLKHKNTVLSEFTACPWLINRHSAAKVY